MAASSVLVADPTPTPMPRMAAAQRTALRERARETKIAVHSFSWNSEPTARDILNASDRGGDIDSCVEEVDSVEEL